MDQKKAERIAKEARKSIWTFCVEECRAYCCRKGYLVLQEDEVDIVMNGKMAEYEGSLKKLGNGKYSLNMGKLNMPCPCLGADFGCRIHDKRKRPLACKEFPLFIKGNHIILSSRCLAVQQDKFFPYIKKLMKEGYDMYIADEHENSEFFNLIKEKEENKGL